MANLNMAADPAKARRVIEFMKRPENVGMNNKEVARALGINESYVRRAKSVFRWGKTMKLNPKKLRMDGGTQSREAIDDAVVAEYVEAWQAGVVFPPVDAFYDGTTYWLADGFHRVIAAIKAGIKSIDVESHQGDAREAILFSVGANAQHGLRRSTADKRKAVLMLLNDEEWSKKWSDREIGRRCGVDHKTVAAYRPDSIWGNSPDSKERIATRGGTKYPMKTGGIGSKSKSQLEPEPEVTEPESVATPDDPAKVTPVESNGVHEKNGSEIARIPATPGPAKAPDPAPIPATQDKAPEPAKVAALASAPASTVDAPKPVDPPDIAAQKAKGIIPKDAVVTVTEPDPADEDEPANVQEELSDQEWLAECPARDGLSEACRKVFDRDALLFRADTEDRKRYFRANRTRLNANKLAGRTGPYHSKLTWFFRTKHPRHWVVCSDCDGTGESMITGSCPTCHGGGFVA